MDATIDSAKRLGITSALPAVGPLALGTGELTLLRLTSPYSAFANQGMRADPVFISRVTDFLHVEISHALFHDGDKRANLFVDGLDRFNVVRRNTASHRNESDAREAQNPSRANRKLTHRRRSAGEKCNPFAILRST